MYDHADAYRPPAENAAGPPVLNPMGPPRPLDLGLELLMAWHLYSAAMVGRGLMNALEQYVGMTDATWRLLWVDSSTPYYFGAIAVVLGIQGVWCLAHLVAVDRIRQRRRRYIPLGVLLLALAMLIGVVELLVVANFHQMQLYLTGFLDGVMMKVTAGIAGLGYALRSTEAREILDA